MLSLCANNLLVVVLESEFFLNFVSFVSIQRSFQVDFATFTPELKSKASSRHIRYAEHS